MRRLVARSAALFGLWLVTAVSAQPPANVLPQPRISSVFPVGARAGSSVEVVVQGTDIDEPTGLLFSNSEIKAEIVVPPEPKPDPKQKDVPKKQPKTGPVTSAKFKITVPASAPVGTYDVRVVSKFGVSNPRAFVIGSLPEELETGNPHNDVPDAQKIELNTTISGTISNTADVDYYVFAGKAQQRILISCLTSSIDSKARPLVELFDRGGKRLTGNRNYHDNDALADATLPADGDYYIRVCEFAYQSGSADHFYRLTASTGPWIDAVYPAAVPPGKPTEVTLYGRNLPGGKRVPGATIDNRPVESLAVTVTPPTERGALAVRGTVGPAQALNDGFEFRLPGSNAVPIYMTDSPVSLEKPSDNDKPETAEPITVPGELAGRVEKRGDKDWFRFQAKKGDSYYVELFADRIGSGMDLYFVVKNAANMGNVVEEQDDDNDVLHPQSFFTRSGDPAAAKFTAPADGEYLILVGSREANTNFGPRSIYRLRVAKANPDFRAVVMAKDRALPTATVAGSGADVALDVFVSRMDGFTGTITATAEGLPAGVSAKPALIGTGQKWATLILSTTDSAAPFTGAITVKCIAQLPGKSVTRVARPASITWGVQPMQNIPTVARLDEQLFLAVRPEKAFFKLAVDWPNTKVKTKDKEGKDVEVKLESPAFVKPGDKITLPVKVTWQGAEPRAQPLNVSLEPTGANVQTAPLRAGQGGNNQPALTMAKDKNEGVITVDVRGQAEPGLYQLVLSGNTQVQFVRDPSKKDQKANAIVSAYAAPLEVTVLPTTLGKFTVLPPANNQLKAGTTAEFTVKVERAADFTGEFKVQLVLPKDTKGVTAKEVAIPVRVDEIKIPVIVEKDVKAGGLNNVVLNATGTVHGKFPISHEVKVNGLQLVALPPEPKKK